MASPKEQVVFRRHSGDISKSLAVRHSACLMLANEMFSRELLTEDVRDEVRGKCGMDAATALLRALESGLSDTPQYLAKILVVMEGLAVMEPSVLKMKKSLPKIFGPKKKATPPSSDVATDSVREQVETQVNLISWIHHLQTKYTELILTFGEALHDCPVQKTRNIVIAALVPSTQATRACISHLQTATSVDEILALLQQLNLCGYLNYRILVAISESHDNSLVRKAVQSYQAEVTAFLKAANVSLAVSVLAKHIKLNVSLPSIVVRLSEAWGSRSLFTLRETLADELDRGEDVQFESAQEGIFIFTFSCLPRSLPSIARELTSTEKYETLQELGVTVVSIDGKEVHLLDPPEEVEERQDPGARDHYMGEISFVESLFQDYYCRLCSKVLADPFQMRCCGGHVCRQCNNQLSSILGVSCPLCHRPDLHTIEDKYFMQLVLSSKVHCYHHEVGCGWEGELQDLERHVDLKDHWCDYVFIPCPFHCGQAVRRCELRDHKTQHCPKRPTTCEHCSYHNTYDVVTEKHSLVCEEFPVECPNQCGVIASATAATPIVLDDAVPAIEAQPPNSCKVKRKELRTHLQNVCPLEMVECEFAIAGCPAKLRRKQMESHLQEGTQQHISMLKDALKSSLDMNSRLSKIIQLGEKTALRAPIVSPPNSDQYRCNIPPVAFTITDVTGLKEENQGWFSPPFYSFLGGHKLQLEVNPNGWRAGKDTHLSVFAYVMQGENDDSLQWPLSAEIEIELLKFGSEEGHHSQVLYLPGDGFCRRVTDRARSAWAHGIEQFVPQSTIFHRSSEYIADGCLRIRVKEMATYSVPNACRIPPWQNPFVSSGSLCEFTLPHFSKCKASNLRFHSPPFYTHPQGYKMSLQVHANGVKDGYGSHISVQAQVMKGEFDDSLEWPFRNDIAYELVNWREDSKHHQGAISFGSFDEKVCSKPVNEIAEYGYLDRKFIHHFALPYDPFTNTQYLQDDCLRFRVKEVALYSTPAVPKCPSWQDPALPSQSLFEFTLNEYSKRKQFNNEYCSTPFYTHPQGYKMEVVVYANGEPGGFGAGTHLSVYARLIKGEYDNDLQWPVSLEVTMHLLNFRRNASHRDCVMRFPPIARCDQALRPRQGHPRFVPHTDLAYNPYEDIEYLQDDCLRFSVNATILNK